MPNESATRGTRSDKAWTFLMSWSGRITAIAGLCATVAGGATWMIAHHRQQQERAAQMTLAKEQATQGDYRTSVETYAVILKSDPLDRAALDGQLDTAMMWAENFSVLVSEGQSATEESGPALDEMMAILESGLTRSKGTRAADVQAHLGWAHWLNQHIAEREFDSTAEQDFRATLAIDPTNVYANAMLGNWMLQNGGDFSEAIQHLDRAVATGRALPFVRRLQLGGLTGYDHEGARRELIKAANSMRVHGETLDPSERRRVFGFCCDIAVSDREALVESLSAVLQQDAWLTYLWLEDPGSESSYNPLQAAIHEYVQANLLEISGQRAQALQQFRTLQQKLRSSPSGALKDDVAAAVTRITHQ